MPTPIVNLSLGTGRWLIVAGACFASFVGCTFEGAPVDSIEPEDAAPNDCVAECVDESTLRSCPDEELIQCSLGCDSGTSECIPFAPSNGALDGNTDLAGADAVLEFASDATIDTDTGEITGIRAAGEGLVGGIGFEILPGDIGLFVVFDLSVDSGVTVSVVGQRALLLLARRDVVIEGLFNASAGLDDCGFGSQLACRGPGGGDGALDDTTPGTGCGPGEDGRDGAGSDETGAGGGAMGEAGADGGDSGVTQAGGDGGTTAACPLPELVPLRGGSGGGFGGEGGAGGGGGGAIQIAAFGVLTISGDLATTGIWTGGASPQSGRHIRFDHLARRAGDLAFEAVGDAGCCGRLFRHCLFRIRRYRLAQFTHCRAYLGYRHFRLPEECRHAERCAPTAPNDLD